MHLKQHTLFLNRDLKTEDNTDFPCYYKTDNPHIVKCRIVGQTINIRVCKAHSAKIICCSISIKSANFKK